MPAARIWVKQKLTLGPLTVSQQQMAGLGFTGLHSVKGRIKSGVNTLDSPAKPLKPAYAKFKVKTAHRRGIRDLFLSTPWMMKDIRAKKKAAKAKGGKFLQPGLMANFQVRTVTDNKVTAGFSTTDQRIKARRMEQLEPFVAFSPNNQASVLNAANSIVRANFQKIVKNG